MTRDGRPLLRVLHGTPTDHELAALTAALLTATPARPAPGGSRRSAWTDRATLVRHPLHPGPQAWRHSALPTR